MAMRTRTDKEAHVRRILVLALLLLLPVSVAAQGPYPIQQSPVPLAPCSFLKNANGATPTATVTPPSGTYVYICGIEITLVCGTTTCTVAAPQTLGTSNLGGLTWTVPTTGVGQAAGTGWAQYFSFPNPIRSANSGTATSVGAAPAGTNGTWNLNIYGWLAP